MTNAPTPGRFESARMRVAVLQHEPSAGLGVFSSLLDRAGVDYEVLETGYVPTSAAAQHPDPQREQTSSILRSGETVRADGPGGRIVRAPFQLMEPPCPLARLTPMDCRPPYLGPRTTA